MKLIFLNLLLKFFLTLTERLDILGFILWVMDSYLLLMRLRRWLRLNYWFVNNIIRIRMYWFCNFLHWS